MAEFETNVVLEALGRAVSETFEGLAFLEVETWKPISKLPELNRDGLATAIMVEKPSQSRMVMYTDKIFSREIVKIITGEEENEPDDNLVCDTMSEVINTIAGRYLSLLIPDSEFDIGLPCASWLNEKKCEKSYCEDMITLELKVEENKIYCVLEYDKN